LFHPLAEGGSRRIAVVYRSRPLKCRAHHGSSGAVVFIDISVYLYAVVSREFTLATP